MCACIPAKANRSGAMSGSSPRSNSGAQAPGISASVAHASTASKYRFAKWTSRRTLSAGASKRPVSTPRPTFWVVHRYRRLTAATPCVAWRAPSIACRRATTPGMSVGRGARARGSTGGATLATAQRTSRARTYASGRGWRREPRAPRRDAPPGQAASKDRGREASRLERPRKRRSRATRARRPSSAPRKMAFALQEPPHPVASRRRPGPYAVFRPGLPSARGLSTGLAPARPPRGARRHGRPAPGGPGGGPAAARSASDPGDTEGEAALSVWGARTATRFGRCPPARLLPVPAGQLPAGRVPGRPRSFRPRCGSRRGLAPPRPGHRRGGSVPVRRLHLRRRVGVGQLR